MNLSSKKNIKDKEKPPKLPKKLTKVIPIWKHEQSIKSKKKSWTRLFRKKKIIPPDNSLSKNFNVVNVNIDKIMVNLTNKSNNDNKFLINSLPSMNQIIYMETKHIYKILANINDVNGWLNSYKNQLEDELFKRLKNTRTHQINVNTRENQFITQKYNNTYDIPLNDINDCCIYESLTEFDESKIKSQPIKTDMIIDSQYNILSTTNEGVNIIRNKYYSKSSSYLINNKYNKLKLDNVTTQYSTS